MSGGFLRRGRAYSLHGFGALAAAAIAACSPSSDDRCSDEACQLEFGVGTRCAPSGLCEAVECPALTGGAIPCTPGVTTTCRTPCGTDGVSRCGPDCAWRRCEPPPELCNTIDDDCDRSVDEGCGSCESCPASIAIANPGGLFYEPTTAATHTGTCGGNGSEFTLVFTVDEVSDVFITTHGSDVDTVVYVRECGCTGPEIACNDDADGQLSSVVRLPELAPGTYEVFVDTKTETSARISAHVYVTPAGRESDRCGNPTFISGDLVQGETCGWTDDYDLANRPSASCRGLSGDGPDRVYYFIQEQTGDSSSSACSDANTFDLVYYARYVCTDGSTTGELGCADNDCPGSTEACGPGLRPQIEAELPSGLYFFIVDGVGTDDCSCGDYSIDFL